MSTIQRERDLQKKASLLKEYLRGEVHLLKLSQFLKHEIDTSNSRSWIRYCMQVQDWIRKNFELGGTSLERDKELGLFLSATREHEEESNEDEGENPQRVMSLLRQSPEWALLQEQDPEALKQILQTAVQDHRDPFRQEKTERVALNEPLIQIDWGRLGKIFQKLLVLLISPAAKTWFWLCARTSKLTETLRSILDFGYSLWLKQKMALGERINSLDQLLISTKRHFQTLWGVAKRALQAPFTWLERIVFWGRSSVSRLFSSLSGSFSEKQSFGIYSMIPLSMCLIFFFTWSPEKGPDLNQAMEMVSSHNATAKESIPVSAVSEEKLETQIEQKDGWSGDFLKQFVTYQKGGKARSHSGSFQDMLADIRKYRTTLSKKEANRDSLDVKEKENEGTPREELLPSSSPVTMRVAKKHPREVAKPSPSNGLGKVKRKITKEDSLVRASQPSKTVAQAVPKSQRKTPEERSVNPPLSKLVKPSRQSAVIAEAPKVKREDQKSPVWKEEIPEKEIEKMLPADGVLNQSVNVLVVGKEAQRRADTIILSRFDLGTGQIRLLSFPRDTRVKIHRSKSEIRDKLSHTLRWGGIEMLKESLEDFSSIKIDYYVEIDLILFRKLINVMGGIEIDVDSDYRYVDKAGGLSIDLKKGRQTLDGIGAEGFVRFRADGRGDLGRIERQQSFIRQFLVKLRSLRKLNWENLKVYARLPSFLVDVIQDVQSDIPSWKYLEFWQAFSKVSLNRVHFSTMAGKAAYVESDTDGKRINYYISSPEQIKNGKRWFYQGQNKLSASDLRKREKLNLEETVN